MNKLHLIMPMGGAGSRFCQNAQQLPKPLIEIYGEPFFYWAAQSVIQFVNEVDITFIVLQEHNDKFKISEKIIYYYPDAKIKIIPEILKGAVCTCLTGVEDINDEVPVLFNDCDHLFCCNELYHKLIKNEDKLNADGILLTFESTEPQFSYVEYDSEGCIIKTVEKQVVSNRAICGAYLFRSAKLFRKMAEKYINNCKYSELYMSGVYNVMCNEKMKIKDYLVDFHVSFGTPKEYELAQKLEYFQYMK